MHQLRILMTFEMGSNERRLEAEEFLLDIETEAKGKRKVTKIKGALLGLLDVAGHSANLLSLTQFLTKAFGIDIPVFNK
jgi:hypothetical protein